MSSHMRKASAVTTQKKNTRKQLNWTRNTRTGINSNVTSVSDLICLAEWEYVSRIKHGLCVPLQASSICVVSESQGRCSPDTRRKVYTSELLSEPCGQTRLHSPLAPHLHKHTINEYWTEQNSFIVTAEWYYWRSTDYQKRQQETKQNKKSQIPLNHPV